MTRFEHEDPGIPQCRPDCIPHRMPSGSYYQELLYILYDLFSDSMTKWLPDREPDKFYLPVNADSTKDTEILSASINILRIQDEDAFHLSADRIKIIGPSSLTESQRCRIENATLQYGKVVTEYVEAPIAAFAAYGYSVDPAVQRKFMTITYDFSRVLEIDLVHTLGSPWLDSEVYHQERKFRVSTGGASSTEHDENIGLVEGLKEFINEFVNLRNPEELILVGTNTEDDQFAQAVSASGVAGLIVPNANNISPEHVLVLGAAKLAKQSLSSQMYKKSEL